MLRRETPLTAAKKALHGEFTLGLSEQRILDGGRTHFKVISNRANLVALGSTTRMSRVFATLESTPEEERMGQVVLHKSARCVLVVLAGFSPVCLGQVSTVTDFNPRVVLKRPMPAIVNAPVVAAAEATERMVADNELVLGVVVNGEARAYPINMLTGPRREIINDELGGRSIAATW